ncbi:UDP-forming cellulose synthase catalytic subunit [Lichenibacterium dinghuense]|uniref:UDP-forming cellulose synthase catalytic subunit n=1 Tax=Lichenibacterium dinghuense TaxID=2895977 RepID=UPI001F0239E6|nr:UDP-forming cellulose synthase catalytic subunit [Lichenibacterium sp. 6Y81]
MKVLATAAWALAGLLFLAMACEPVGIQAQFVLGAATVGAMGLIRLLRLDGAWRKVFLALGTGLVLRYLYWRTTSTLPPVSDPVSFACGLTLYLAELYSIGMLFISLFVIADPLDRPPAPRLADEDLPTVDVLVPSYNEDRDLLAVTLAAATALHYPADRLSVHLLDDGGTDQKCDQEDAAAAGAARRRRAELMGLCADLGVTYHTRAKNLHAKAGNMNAALADTDGELVVVFDADHVPMPDFLQETVGHFRRDPRLFLCQTPHFFSNPDPIEKNLATFETMPSENEMFYGVIQRGLDKWNAAFFCGSAAVLRRAALDEVGGFSGLSITEDCETALDLHARGWNSLYVDRPMICGLQPETFASFIGQRSRWCRGMFQIFLLKNPLFKRGLSLAQRVCYLSNMTYWFFPLFRLPFLVAPFLYIWFSLQIYVANVHEFVSYTLIYMVVNVMMQNTMYGKVRWPFVSELYEFTQSIFLCRGLVSVVMNPRKPTFNVTDKGNTLEKDFLSELALPYFAIYGLILLSQVYAAWRFATEPDGGDLMLVVSLWNFLNLLLAGAGLGVVSERRAVAKPLGRPAELAIGTTIVPVKIDAISVRGCTLSAEPGAIPARLGRGTVGILAVPRRPGHPAQTLPVALDGPPGDGIAAFTFPQLKAEHHRLIAATLHPGSEALEAFREKRRNHKSILGGVAAFVRWGLVEPLRGFAFLGRHLAGLRRPEPAVPQAAEPAPARHEPASLDGLKAALGPSAALADEPPYAAVAAR